MQVDPTARAPSAHAGQSGKAAPVVAAAIQVPNAPLPEMPTTTPHAVTFPVLRCVSGATLYSRAGRWNTGIC